MCGKIIALLLTGVGLAASVAGRNEDLLAASNASDKAGVEAALAQGASVNAVDPLGRPGQTTSIGIAAAGGHANVVAFLLAHGANVDGADGLAQSPLHMAAEHGSTDVSNSTTLFCPCKLAYCNGVAPRKSRASSGAAVKEQSGGERGQRGGYQQASRAERAR
jgi:Ankyrin repeats (3 copies)